MEKTIKLIALRDVEIKLKQRQIVGEIVPDNVFEVLKELDNEYKNDFDIKIKEERWYNDRYFWTTVMLFVCLLLSLIN